MRLQGLIPNHQRGAQGEVSHDHSARVSEAQLHAAHPWDGHPDRASQEQEFQRTTHPLSIPTFRILRSHTASSNARDLGFQIPRVRVQIPPPTLRPVAHTSQSSISRASRANSLQILPPETLHPESGSWRSTASGVLSSSSRELGLEEMEGERTLRELWEGFAVEVSALGLAGPHREAQAVCDDLPAMHALLRNRPGFFKRYRLILGDNKAVVLAALALKGGTLIDVSTRLRGNRTVVLAALRVNKGHCKFASQVLRRDHDFLLSVIWEHGAEMVKHASSEPRGNGEFILRAMALDPLAVRFAKHALKCDAGFGLKAITLCPDCLSSLDETLVGNPQFIGRAIEAQPKVIRPLLQREMRRAQRSHITLSAIERHCEVFAWLCEEQKKDRTFIESAAARNMGVLRFVDTDLTHDRHLFAQLVQTNGLTLAFAAEPLKHDWEIALSALVQNPRALEYVSQDLRGNRAFILSALRGSSNSIASMELWNHLSEELRGDQEITNLVWGDLPAFSFDADF